VDTLETEGDGKVVKLSDSDPEFVALVEDESDSETLPVTLAVSEGLP
jgi:hypothetical protein